MDKAEKLSFNRKNRQHLKNKRNLIQNVQNCHNIELHKGNYLEKMIEYDIKYFRPGEQVDVDEKFFARLFRKAKESVSILKTIKSAQIKNSRKSRSPSPVRKEESVDLTLGGSDFGKLVIHR
jgi:hypothetical protein